MVPVLVAEEILELDSYGSPEPESLPMFAENRVHQRSSGNPYPNRVVVRVDRQPPKRRQWQAIRMENEYIRIVILPELGGRIYEAYDKVNACDFFYKQHVIKPALIGLLGSWVSGGCEFNWPCHHRPSTFMPTDVSIKREEGGAVTVWLSEHEPLDRMKGMVGVRVAPESSVLETRMRVYNRTSLRRSFLWWENVAVPCGEDFEIFFPPDVSYVQFHYRKNVTSYPVAGGVYNGIRLGEGTDIRYHKHTRRPTSYFSAASAYDFFGGYDAGKGRGVVHVADRHTSPGKKLFTWAYNELAKSWEKALTDTDGQYAELMAGSYSNNQPDFAWLEAYETRTFTQSWYPIGAMGAPTCANREAAIAITRNGEDRLEIRMQSTRPMVGATLRVERGGKTVCEQRVDLIPGTPVRVPCGEAAFGVSCTLLDGAGVARLHYTERRADPMHRPTPLPDLPGPDVLSSAQDAYLAGVHVEQYRDPAARPESYYAAALQRDPTFAPALTAMARRLYERFDFEGALAYAQRALRSLTRYNDHPESGEHAYVRGLILDALGRDEAYDAFHDAAWNADARARAMIRIAMLDGRRGAYEAMRRHAMEAVRAHADASHARVMEAVAEIGLGNGKRAALLLDGILKLDPLDHLARAVMVLLEAGGADSAAVPEEALRAFFDAMRSDASLTMLDIVEDLCGMGWVRQTMHLLAALPEKSAMATYTLGYLRDQMGDGEGARQQWRLAAQRPLGPAFPSRLIEWRALERALLANPGDAVALELRGCLRYDAGHHERAAKDWEDAIAHAPDRSAPYRNLAVALYSHLGQRQAALPLLQKALERAPEDGQLLYEALHVMARLDVPAQKRIQWIQAHGVRQMRDDIVVEWARALNHEGAHEQALEKLLSHTFTPCEGGEHYVAEQYLFAHRALAHQAMGRGAWREALALLKSAFTLPESLGTGLWHEALHVPLQWDEAVCHRALGEMAEARALCEHIAGLSVDYFSNMHLAELPYYQVHALRLLGREAEALTVLSDYVRRFEEARTKKSAGYLKTTPFFISYMEDADTLRQAVSDYHLGLAHWLAGEPGQALALIHRSRKNDPTHLGALMASWDLAREGMDAERAAGEQ